MRLLRRSIDWILTVKWVDKAATSYISSSEEFSDNVIASTYFGSGLIAAHTAHTAKTLM